MKKEQQLQLLIYTILVLVGIVGVILFKVNHPVLTVNNLLKNGGFEEYVSGKPLYWRLGSWGRARGIQVIDHNTVYRGRVSFHMKRSNSLGGLEIVSNLIPLNVEKISHNQLNVTVCYKGELSCRIIFRELAEDGSELGLKNAKGRELAINRVLPDIKQWRKTDLKIPFPKEVKGIENIAIRIQLYLAPAQQQAWVDDVSAF